MERAIRLERRDRFPTVSANPIFPIFGSSPGRNRPRPGPGEFPKNSINIDKFTGFFDKFPG